MGEPASPQTRCRLLGAQEAQTKDQLRLALALRQAFEAEPAVVLIEPGVGDGRNRPPDIVLLHPRLGVHVLEVKGVVLDQVLAVEGGGVVCINYKDHVYRRNPISQAMNAVFDVKGCVERRLQADMQTPLGAWVLWPRISRESWCNRFTGVDKWPDDWLFEEDIKQSAWIERLTRQARRKMADAGLDLMPRPEWMALGAAFGDNAVLRPDARARPGRRVTESTLGWVFDQRANDYAALSDEQQELVRQDWDSGPRLVRGVAGSGKTIVLASHLARRLKRMLVRGDGLFPEDRRRPRILAVCFNRTLVPHLRQKIEVAFRQRTGGDVPEGCVHVTNLNRLMYELSRRGLVPYLPVKSLADTERASRYLEALRQAYASRRGDLAAFAFDAIYIDEGQDFLEDDYRCLQALCRQTLEQQEPSLFAFYDDAQNLYGRTRPNWASLGLNMIGRSFVMTESFRNTRAIVEPAFNVLVGACADTTRGGGRGFADVAYLQQKGALVQREDGSYEATFAKRCDGFLPRHMWFESRRAELDWLCERVTFLLAREQVRAQDILVLTARRDRAEEVAEQLGRVLPSEVGVHLATQEKDELIGRHSKLTVSTVASAKGLDAYVVLLVSADAFDEDLKGRAAFYVGCTRARELMEVTGVGGSARLLTEYGRAMERVEVPSVS